MRRAGMACALALCGALALVGCGSGSTQSRGAASQQLTVKDVLNSGMEELDGSAAEEADAAEESEPQTSSGAQATPGDQPEEAGAVSADGVDVNLTYMDGDMVYATVVNMLSNPEDYRGKSVRMDGTFLHTHNDGTGVDYTAVLVKDAMSCCAQGFEFVWGDGSHVWPEGYPKDGTPLVVTGTFEPYMDGDIPYVHLVNATMVVEDDVE